MCVFKNLKTSSKLIHQKPLYKTYYEDYICVHDRTLLFCSSIDICLFKLCQDMPALKGSPINRTERMKYVCTYIHTYIFHSISFCIFREL